MPSNRRKKFFKFFFGQDQLRSRVTLMKRWTHAATTKTMNNETKLQSKAETDSGIEQPRRAQPKWAVIVNDETIPMPQRLVEVALIRSQAAIEPDVILVRDHDSPNDVLLK